MGDQPRGVAMSASEGMPAAHVPERRRSSALAIGVGNPVTAMPANSHHGRG